MKIGILKKTNLSETVYQQFLTAIRNGELKAGDKLPSEAELCKMLGVSRTVLREGMRVLAGINVLTIVPGRGTFINEEPDILVESDALNISLERETIESIYEVRTILSVGIAKYATKKATEENIVALEKAINKMEKSIQLDFIDIDLAIKADEEFHIELYRATRNAILEKMAWPIEKHAMLRSWKQLGGSSEIVSQAIEGHKRILEAIKRGDVNGAMGEMERHLEVVFELLSALQE